MIFNKPILDKHDKTANDFINYLCDGTRNRDLWKYKGNTMVKIDSNDGSGGKIYVDKRILPIVDKFISE